MWSSSSCGRLAFSPSPEATFFVLVKLWNQIEIADHICSTTLLYYSVEKRAHRDESLLVVVEGGDGRRFLNEAKCRFPSQEAHLSLKTAIERNNSRRLDYNSKKGLWTSGSGYRYVRMCLHHRHSFECGPPDEYLLICAIADTKTGEDVLKRDDETQSVCCHPLIVLRLHQRISDQ